MLVDLPTIFLLAFFKKHLEVASVILMATNNKTLITKYSVVPTFKKIGVSFRSKFR